MRVGNYLISTSFNVLFFSRFFDDKGGKVWEITCRVMFEKVGEHCGNLQTF